LASLTARVEAFLEGAGTEDRLTLSTEHLLRESLRGGKLGDDTFRLLESAFRASPSISHEFRLDTECAGWRQDDPRLRDLAWPQAEADGRRSSRRALARDLLIRLAEPPRVGFGPAVRDRSRHLDAEDRLEVARATIRGPYDEATGAIVDEMLGDLDAIAAWPSGGADWFAWLKGHIDRRARTGSGRALAATLVDLERLDILPADERRRAALRLDLLLRLCAALDTSPPASPRTQTITNPSKPRHHDIHPAGGQLVYWLIAISVLIVLVLLFIR
jgi:hypothetical protein